MVRIAIIIGSTRPARKGATIARWVHEIAKQRSDAEYELIDIKDYELPLLDEPMPAAMNQYTQPHTRRWSEKIAAYDGFVFVTPEYNHGTSAALKNALDYLYKEWANKACGFVGYGGAGGARAIEQLRAIVSNLDLADVRSAVSFMLAHDFENMSVFRPGAHQEKAVNDMLDQVVAWTTALKPLRHK